MPTVLLAMDHLAPEIEERLRALAPGYDLLVTRDAETIAAAMPEIEVVSGHIGLEQVLAMPNLRWYQQWGAGAEWIMEHPEIRERDLVVTNVSGVHAVPISEHLLAMMLALARRIDAVRAGPARMAARRLVTPSLSWRARRCCSSVWAPSVIARRGWRRPWRCM